MIKKLHLYIVKEFLASFLFGLVVFSVLLLLNQLFELVDLFFSKGASFFIVVKLFILLLPNILTLAIPMAVLFGVLIAYGRLSEDNEITAMKSSGTNYKTLSIPIIAFVCIISFFLLFFNHFLSPLTHSKFKNSLEEILTKKPLVKFHEKTINELGRYYLYANKVNSKNNTLSGVSIYKFENENINKNNDKKNILPQNDNGAWRIAASSATVKIYQGGIQLILYNGYWQKAHPSDINNMLHMTFKSYCFFIPLGDVIKGHISTAHEMSSCEILKTIRTYKEQNLPFIEYEHQFWSRWIFAFAPLVFVLVALPIGIMAGKGGKVISFGMGLGIVSVYYILLMIAITLSEKGYVPTSLIMWMPNIVVTIAGIWLFIKMVKK
ncbi:MAG: LptF/LptG family permease [Endomicrobium sp.]|jgi:lipopolysaccharide export system permease protein|nr:LptF/LptG family permease [Endomicrobium sp.]